MPPPISRFRTFTAGHAAAHYTDNQLILHHFSTIL
jgi:hypothetical protein